MQNIYSIKQKCSCTLKMWGRPRTKTYRRC